MNTEYLSIYLYLWFPLSMPHSFHYRGLSLPWLNLFLFYCFWCYYKWDGYVFFSDNSLLVYRNVTDFCIWILYPATLLNSLLRSNSVFEILDFLYMYSCHLKIETILFLSFKFRYLFFFLPNCSGGNFQCYVE